MSAAACTTVTHLCCHSVGKPRQCQRATPRPTVGIGPERKIVTDIESVLEVGTGIKIVPEAANATRTETVAGQRMQIGIEIASETEPRKRMSGNGIGNRPMQLAGTGHARGIALGTMAERRGQKLSTTPGGDTSAPETSVRAPMAHVNGERNGIVRLHGHGKSLVSETATARKTAPGSGYQRSGHGRSTQILTLESGSRSGRHGMGTAAAARARTGPGIGSVTAAQRRRRRRSR